MIDTIYIDMDEVLVDFTRGYCEFIKVNYEAVLQHWPRGEWLMLPALNKVLGRTEETQITLKEFWDNINGRTEFWENLEALPWFTEILNLCYSYTYDVHIVSSPSYCDTCYTGKVRWLKKRFGLEFTNFHLTPHKEKLARPGTVLIDDSEKNCQNFLVNKNGRSTGAYSVIFPRHSNGIGNITDPVTYVKSQLDDIMEEMASYHSN